MTRLSVWTVRTALLYLGAGFLIGALMLTQKGLPFDPAMLRLLPLHIEVCAVRLDAATGDGHRLLDSAALQH